MDDRWSVKKYRSVSVSGVPVSPSGMIFSHGYRLTAKGVVFQDGGGAPFHLYMGRGGLIKNLLRETGAEREFGSLEMDYGFVNPSHQ
jgi:hypothetical protein